MYCGDDNDSKDVAIKLIQDTGFDPVDAGSLRIARYTEPFALLVGELADGGDTGPYLIPPVVASGLPTIRELETPAHAKPCRQS